jgi:ABC-type multidrug transport system fused ATPase/permease subunit
MNVFSKTSVIRLSISVLEPNDRRKYFFAIVAQSALAFLDLVGVALVSLLGSLAIRGVQSQGPGNRVSSVLNFLNLDGLTFQNQVSVLSIFAVALLSAKTILSYFFTRRLLMFLSLKSANISANLINKTLSSGHLAIQEKSKAQIQYSTGDGVTAMIVGILGLSSNLIADLFLLLVLVSGIFIVDPYSAITTMVFFGSVGIILYFGLHKRARKTSKRVVELNIEGSQTLFEIIGTFREIYVRNRQTYYLEKLTAIKREHAVNTAKQTLLPNISKYAIEMSVTLGTLLVAAVQFSTQDASRAAASLALFLAAGSRLAPALLRIQQSSIQIQSNASLAYPTLSLLEEYKDIEPLSHPQNTQEAYGSDFDPTVELADIGFTYPQSSKLAIDNVNLTLPKGELIALVGPSGSGKSTLVDLILGLLEPSHGSVKISGINSANAIEKWPGRIGYVPQSVNLINDTVERNLELGYLPGSISHDLKIKALKEANLGSLDLKYEVGENGSKLSGGQRQRLGIARALLFEPQLLILDEATSALDSETEFAISDSLNNLKGKVTLLVVAHRLSTVKNADIVVYLDNGKIRSVGTFDEVRMQIPAFDSQAKLMGL